MTTTLPLTIALLVFGVCSTRGELSSWYPLQNCKSNSPQYFKFKASGCSYEFFCREDNPMFCNLVERFSSGQAEFGFKKANVEFISIENEKMTLTMRMHPNEDVKWDITCEFSSPALRARLFHKFITQDRLSELVQFLQADYLKTSEYKMSIKKPTLYLDGFECNITIVVKNDKGEAVLVMPKNAISKITLRESTKVDLLAEITGGRKVLYEFGFSTPEHASAWNQLLNMLSQSFQAKSSLAYRRPNRDPAVDEFFRLIEREIPR